MSCKRSANVSRSHEPRRKGNAHLYTCNVLAVVQHLLANMVFIKNLQGRGACYFGSTKHAYISSHGPDTLDDRRGTHLWKYSLARSTPRLPTGLALVLRPANKVDERGGNATYVRCIRDTAHEGNDISLALHLETASCPRMHTFVTSPSALPSLRK